MSPKKQPNKSTPRRKARSTKRSSPSGRPAAGRPPAQATPRIPPAIELAIDVQRESIETAISLLYCLHSALRREIEDAGTVESEAVEDASEEADLTDITAMLLVRLNSIHIALDSMELGRAKVDPEMLQLTEMARELVGSNERERQS